ncbi:G-protein coupled receptor Mth2 isoform X3 [Orussus abietinus]|uniref:G-protein coupled receptor Mth2 isoform X3 n=1 Tax=Orussus abietinus TaxID=222816 RepID=UPI000C715E4C|nr:G-protein coupled receptor Mth2 isoform X3 [Orussus abietinus]
MRTIGLVGIVLIVWTPSSTSTSAPCPRSLSVPLKNPRPLPNGSLEVDNLTYPKDLYWTLGDDLLGCVCNLTEKCIRRCCGSGIFNGTCVDWSPQEGRSHIQLHPEELSQELKGLNRVEDAFYTVDNMICPGSAKYRLNPKMYPDDRFVLHRNGSLVTVKRKVLLPQDYCLTWSLRFNETIAVVCFRQEDRKQAITMTIYPIGIAFSVPFLMITFLVYVALPELRNLHGKTVMCYVGALALGYSFLFVVQVDHDGAMPYVACKTLAFIIHFSFLASFFWLNVMCFDIWWTFGGFRSLQGSAKQREKKKFIMYSIYAWGCATLLTAVCMVMDLVPGIPKHYIRPEFGVGSCWYYTNMARAIYFYGPMGVTVACNICLFVSTAIKIVRHKKDTAHHLKGSDSRRHDDNKQWFNLYLKLFIVMGISWSMEIISWLFEESSPKYIWYVSDIGNTLQGVIIFVIFVWKSKIKRLLLKRFGCQDRNFLSRESTRSAYNSSSRTCTTSAPLQEKANPYVDANFRQKTTSEDSDDV